MGKSHLEIERKFLTKSDSWRSQVSENFKISQGYLLKSKEKTIRVRTYGNKAFLTIKFAKSLMTREEFEYEIPVEDCLLLLKKCEGTILEKVRHVIIFQNQEWTIDEFFGHRAGLVLAEIELSSENQEIFWPEWLGEEVTQNPCYFNSNL